MSRLAVAVETAIAVVGTETVIVEAGIDLTTVTAGFVIVLTGFVIVTVEVLPKC